MGARKNTHKQAEQRRRDTLKQYFDDMRDIIPPMAEKMPSKIDIMRAAYEYVKVLKDAKAEQEAEMQALRDHIKALEKRLGTAETGKPTSAASGSASSTMGDSSASSLGDRTQSPRSELEACRLAPVEEDRDNQPKASDPVHPAAAMET
ncbi:hypothetical protein BC831DRAFT_459124 [Entophlyctis helioformis]|nr:hypothetical protein BC831DRAFT_459124 [Entophlyctis helioformis]